jgi:hypothetical protein
MQIPKSVAFFAINLLIGFNLHAQTQPTAFISTQSLHGQSKTTIGRGGYLHQGKIIFVGSNVDAKKRLKDKNSSSIAMES